MIKSSKKYWLIIAVVITLLAGGMDRASATLLTDPGCITCNWGFENNDPHPNATTWSVLALDGWTKTNETGVQGTFYADRPGAYVSTPSSRVAFSNGGTLSQTLPNFLTSGHLYTLTVDVGNRYPTGFPGYSIELWAGGSQINPDSYYPPNPLDGTFDTAILTYLATPTSPLLGGQLEIRLTSAGIQTNFDNVRLTNNNTIPEPATVLLLGSGLLGVAWFGKKKFKASKS